MAAILKKIQNCQNIAKYNATQYINNKMNGPYNNIEIGLTSVVCKIELPTKFFGPPSKHFY